MKIEHVAIWVRDLEAMRAFYEGFFNAKSGAKYENPRKQFSSYFLSFSGGARLELMHRPEMALPEWKAETLGIAHLAIALGSRQKVDLLTDQLRQNGFQVVGEPRLTGDGYYESVVLDPEGNRLELTA